jgi:hypothetical protein
MPERRNLLVDIKGRKAHPAKNDWSYDPWITQDDIDALTTWQGVFGKSFAAVFVFAFLLEDIGRVNLFEPFKFQERHYRFFAIYLDDYRDYVKPRSQRWKTVTIPREVFRELAWNLDAF